MSLKQSQTSEKPISGENIETQCGEPNHKIENVELRNPT